MRVLLLSINFHPETIGVAPLVTDLALALRAKGHRTTVVTGLPTYPGDQVFEGYGGRLGSEEGWQGGRGLRPGGSARSRRPPLPRPPFLPSLPPSPPLPPL